MSFNYFQNENSLCVYTDSQIQNNFQVENNFQQFPDEKDNLDQKDIQTQEKLEKVKVQFLSKRGFIKFQYNDQSKKKHLSEEGQYKIFQKNLQKQLNNILIATLYKVSKDEEIKKRIQVLVEQKVKNWLMLIDTNQKLKFDNQNKNLNLLKKLNDMQKQSINDKEKQQKNNQNEKKLVFLIKSFNQNLKDIGCEIQIQKSTQSIELKKQINGIRNFIQIKRNQNRDQNQFEYTNIEQQINALEEFIKEIIRKKRLLQKKELAFSLNFNNDDFFLIWKNEKKFQKEFENLLTLIQKGDQEILKLFNLTQKNKQFDFFLISTDNLFKGFKEGNFGIKKKSLMNEKKVEENNELIRELQNSQYQKFQESQNFQYQELQKSQYQELYNFSYQELYNFSQYQKFYEFQNLQYQKFQELQNSQFQELYNFSYQELQNSQYQKFQESQNFQYQELYNFSYQELQNSQHQKFQSDLVDQSQTSQKQKLSKQEQSHQKNQKRKKIKLQ